MKSISDFKKRVGRYGGIKNAKIAHSKKSIGFFFQDSPSYEEVRINNSEEITGVQIVSDTKNPVIKHILMKPNDKISPGDLIYRTKLEEGVWLCTGIDPNEVYLRGIIDKCNFVLKWVDSDGYVHSSPCILHYGTKANFGVYSDKVMTLPDSRRQIVLPKNEHTSKLKVDDRFIIGGSAFKVIDYDYVSDEGVVNLNLEGSEIDEANDNLKLGIANYYNKVATYALNILNGSSVSIEKTQQLQVTTEVRKNNKVVADPLLHYSISDDTIATINENGVLSPIQKGEVLITVSFMDLSETITVNITDTVSNNYTVEISGSNLAYLNSTKNYSAIFRNNGVAFDESSFFYLTGEDGESNTTLASITSQDSLVNACTLKFGSKPGAVILHVQNPSELIKSSMRIQIKSLL